jgi:thymidylate kinase
MKANNNNTIITIDGHDGTGKTTLCRLLAKYLVGYYVRPFSGSTGESLLKSANEQDYVETMLIGKNAIRKVCDSYRNKTLIFDRHWMTVLSLLPESYHGNWDLFPPTILCWTDLKTTKSRIASREEEKLNDIYHNKYLEIYKKLANTYNIPIINTSNITIETSMLEIINWLNRNRIIT